MKKLTVALLQILPAKTREENLQKGIEACRKAKKSGADIALFPEMWSDGYRIPEDIEALKAEAVCADGEFVSAFGKLAAELNMAVGITFLECWEPLPRNTLVLFDRHGKRALTYAKVHTCDFGDEARLTAGEDFYVAQLDTAAGEIVLVPNACPMEINRLSQLRGRAYENMFGIATCNYPCGQPDCNGHSSAFDGVAYLPELSGSRDTCLLEAGGETGVYLAAFDLDMLREYRKSEVHGNAYRHPQKYRLLLDEQIQEPFIRKDYRK